MPQWVYKRFFHFCVALLEPKKQPFSTNQKLSIRTNKIKSFFRLTAVLFLLFVKHKKQEKKTSLSGSFFTCIRCTDNSGITSSYTSHHRNSRHNPYPSAQKDSTSHRKRSQPGRAPHGIPYFPAPWHRHAPNKLCRQTDDRSP